MIYIKYFELGDKNVMIVPRRNKWAVRSSGYKSPRYKGVNINSFVKYNYDLMSGSLSECNDIFNLEVTYLCRMYDEQLYNIASLIMQKDEVNF